MSTKQLVEKLRELQTRQESGQLVNGDDDGDFTGPEFLAQADESSFMLIKDIEEMAQETLFDAGRPIQRELNKLAAAGFSANPAGSPKDAPRATAVQIRVADGTITVHSVDLH